MKNYKVANITTCVEVDYRKDTVNITKKCEQINVGALNVRQ